MNVLIRTDSSIQIGMGHLMRCLALAIALKENGVRVIFVMREPDSKAMDKLTRAGFEYGVISSLMDDALATARVIQSLAINLQWIIVDHYQLHADWHTQMRRYAKKIMVIDDLANRVYDCDLLLNQNVGAEIHKNYHHFVGSHTQMLLGPSFALLRDEFSLFRKTLKPRAAVIKRVLISFGGGDSSEETMKALLACLKLNKNEIAIDVVVGTNDGIVDDIKHLCDQRNNMRFFHQITNMAEIMSQADVAIGAGGITNWERCSLGLPAIVVSIAENQVAVAHELALSGATKYLGASDKVSESDIVATLADFMNNPQILLNMSINAANLVDGEGCWRVAAALIHTA